MRRSASCLCLCRTKCNNVHCCISVFVTRLRKELQEAAQHKTTSAAGATSNQHRQLTRVAARTHPLTYLYMYASMFAFHYAKERSTCVFPSIMHPFIPFSAAQERSRRLK